MDGVPFGSDASAALAAAIGESAAASASCLLWLSVLFGLHGPYLNILGTGFVFLFQPLNEAGYRLSVIWMNLDCSLLKYYLGCWRDTACFTLFIGWSPL